MTINSNTFKDKDQSSSMDVFSDDSTQDPTKDSGTLTAPPTAVPQQLSTTTTASISGQSQTPATPKTAKKGSGTFTNLNKYLDANKQGGQQIATGLSDQLKTQASDIGAAIDEKQAQMSGQITGQTTAANTAFGKAQAAIADPTQFLQQQAGAQAGAQLTADEQANAANVFQGYMKGQVGDTNFADSQTNLNQQYQDQIAQRNAELSKLQQSGQGIQEGVAGRFEGLRNLFQKPGQRYTEGMSRLDALLFGGDPNAQAKVQEGLGEVTREQDEFAALQVERQGELDRLADAAGQFGNLGEMVRTEGSSMDELIAQQAKDYEVNKQSLVAELQRAFQTGEFSSDLVNKLDLEGRQSIDDLIKSGKLGVTGGTVSDQYAKDFSGYGVDLGAIKGDLYNRLEARDILDPNVAGHVGRAMTADQRAKMNALSQLSGIQGLSQYQAALPQNAIENLERYESADVALTGADSFMDTLTARQGQRQGAISKVAEGNAQDNAIYGKQFAMDHRMPTPSGQMSHDVADQIANKIKYMSHSEVETNPEVNQLADDMLGIQNMGNGQYKVWGQKPGWTPESGTPQNGYFNTSANDPAVVGVLNRKAQYLDQLKRSREKAGAMIGSLQGSKFRYV